MKIQLVLFLLLFSTLVKSQDSLFCYNNGAINVNEPVSEAEATVFPKSETSLILMPVMNEKEVVLLLKEKNNSDINQLIRKFRLTKMFQNIGFSAIPEALLGAGFIGAANTYKSSNSSAAIQKGVGVGLIALSTVCLTSNICFKIIKNKNYKKAIRKYNQLYN